MRTASRALAALAFLCLATSGCLGGGTEAADGADVVESDGVEGPSLPLAFGTAWEGDLVLAATVASDDPTTCTMDVGYESAGRVHGWEMAFLELRGPDVAPGWMIVSNSVQEVRVHAAGTAVGGVNELQPGWLESSWTVEDVAGPVTILAAVRGLDPAGGKTLEVRLDCAGPARLEALEAGADLALWDASANAGGAGARAGALFAEAGAAVADRVAISTTKPRGLAFLQEGYGQAGVVDLSTPEGDQQLVLRPHFDDEPQWVVVHSGPGDYAASYDEVDIVAGGHWGLLAGLGPISDMAGLLGLSGHGHGCEATACP